MTLTRPAIVFSVLIALMHGAASVWTHPAAVLRKPGTRDLDIASRFAPIFYQALGEDPRGDYITNFDFDGDWRGDNNWNNLDDKRFPLKAYVYYSVAETVTHYFVHYAVFHPRDYKGGAVRGAILSELIREGLKRGGKYDPTGMADEAALAHENDMEGALVVIKKNGSDLKDSRVEFVETLHHNSFARYVAGESAREFSFVRIENHSPVLYIEPKGHGIEAFFGDQKQTARKEFLRYVFDGKAQEPSSNSICRDVDITRCEAKVSYELVPLSVLWLKSTSSPNETYGTVCDYAEVKLSTSIKPGTEAFKSLTPGKVGCAFLGQVGGENMARPPWGWFDRDDRSEPLGRWFFDPATRIKGDFNLDDKFSTSYVRLPFWAQ